MAHPDLQNVLVKTDLIMMDRCKDKQFVIEQSFRIEFITTVDFRTLPLSVKTEFIKKTNE